MDLELYLYFKIQKMNAWCIRPANWAGVWNGNKELCEGRYTALFNTEEEAKQICDQLNQAYYQDQIIREAREKLNQDIGDLINYGDGHFTFPSEIVKSLKLYLEILDRNVK